ncbi:MAG: ribonuclease III [Chloroflexi bacterium]|nr:ribonuclease III [Chloroflexota bacterium]
MDKPELSALQKSLGVTFRDLSLLEQALVHSSYLNEYPGLGLVSNERLEFLGDAVLGLVIAEKLYRDFPEYSEGEMTRLRSALVRRETLASVARDIRLGNHLYMGKGEESGGGRNKPRNLAGALEALIAAIYLEQGFEMAQEIVLRLFDGEIEKVTRGEAINYKSQLQELVQAQGQPSPTYHVVEAAGPDHARKFTVEVRVGERVLGRGSGKSKKAAETEAARAALERERETFTR